jgi:predicted membrane protein
MTYTEIMFILILFLVIGSIMVYLAQNNLTPVILRLGTYEFTGIPLFYIIIGSLLTGLGLAYLVYLINSIFTALSLRRKDKKIKQTKSEVVELTKRIHQLELENERLKNNSALVEPQDKNAL